MEIIHEDITETVYQIRSGSELKNWTGLYELINNKHLNQKFRTLSIAGSMFVSFLN